MLEQCGAAVANSVIGRHEIGALAARLVLVLSMAVVLAQPVRAAPGVGDALPIREVAPGVFVHAGIHASATPENAGAIANVGFIVGARCVAVVDSGGSAAEGNALLAAIRQHTALPVCYVINTHVHPDHVYGNAAFVADKPQFVGHRNLAAAMRARQSYYTQYLERTLGPVLAAPSALVFPDKAIADGETLDLGGRVLRLQAWPTSHTDTDLTVLDETSGTLWLGDLLFTERIPVVDGKVVGWLATMQRLRSIAAVRVVPGHGPVSTDWPGVLVPQERYLVALRDGVRAALKARRTIGQAAAEVGLSERGAWQLFDDFNPHNVTVVYTELEWED